MRTEPRSQVTIIVNLMKYVHVVPEICWQTDTRENTHTHTHPFNGPLSGNTGVSRYQKGKTSQDFTEAKHSEWQRHHLGYMQVCTSLQTDNHTSTPPLSFFTGRMPFLPPNQQRQSTVGKDTREIQTEYFFLANSLQTVLKQ